MEIIFSSVTTWGLLSFGDPSTEAKHAFLHIVEKVKLFSGLEVQINVYSFLSQSGESHYKFN